MKKIGMMILLTILLIGCGPASPPKDLIRYGFYNCSKYTVKVVYYYMINNQYEKQKEEIVVKPEEKLSTVNMGAFEDSKVATKIEFYKVNNESEEICHAVEFKILKDIIGFDDGVVYEDKTKREVDLGGEQSSRYFYYLTPNLDSDVWK